MFRKFYIKDLVKFRQVSILAVFGSYFDSFL